MKDKDGYTIRKNEDGTSDYYLHEYLVDGCKSDSEDFDELDRCATMAEVRKAINKYKKQYEWINVWDEWVEADINEYGFTDKGSVVRQVLLSYENGVLVSRTKMI